VVILSDLVLLLLSDDLGEICDLIKLQRRKIDGVNFEVRTDHEDLEVFRILRLENLHPNTSWERSEVVCKTDFLSELGDSKFRGVKTEDLCVYSI